MFTVKQNYRMLHLVWYCLPRRFPPDESFMSISSPYHPRGYRGGRPCRSSRSASVFDRLMRVCMVSLTVMMGLSIRLLYVSHGRARVSTLKSKVLKVWAYSSYKTISNRGKIITEPQLIATVSRNPLTGSPLFSLPLSDGRE